MSSVVRHIGSVEISTPSDRDVAISRPFNAPRRLVYRALTEPDLVRRWLGVLPGWTFDVCEIDLRVGGAYRYHWRGPNMDMGLGGVYREIVPLERLVTTEKYDQSWYPGEAVGTLVLTGEGEKTHLVLTMTYDTKEARDAVLTAPMALEGLAGGYDKLEAEITRMMAEGL